MQNPLDLPDFCFPAVFASCRGDPNRVEISHARAHKRQQAEKKTKPFPKSEDSTVKLFEMTVQERDLSFFEISGKSCKMIRGRRHAHHGGDRPKIHKANELIVAQWF